MDTCEDLPVVTPSPEVSVAMRSNLQGDLMGGQWLGIVLGGVIPAVLFACMALFAKASTEQGTGVGVFMLSVSVAVGGVGLLALRLLPLREISPRGISYAFLGGLCWALGAGLIAFALLRYDTPIAKLGPLHNTSALLVALGGLLVFSEGRNASIWQLLLGAVLIMVGGVLVVKA